MTNATVDKTPRKKPSSRKRKKKKSWAARHSLAILIASISVLLMIASGVIFCMQTYKGEDRWIYIPKESDSEAVRDSLRSALGISEGNRTYLMWKTLRGKESVAHGAYFVKNDTKSLAIAKRLKTGTQTPVKISFAYARNLDEMARKITPNIECTPENFITAAQQILDEKGYTSQQYPAAFLPDTYEVYWTDSPEKLVNRLLKARDNFWNEERRQKASQLGLTPVQVATLAAIVEEETLKNDERPKVARLYLNRLKKGMKLQADPTVKFATGDPTLRRITNRHLQTPSPYNTYLHAGLPPGPIRIPAASTLDAVLNAPQHNYLYMCAKEDFSGYHNFASDYNTHLANARRYQAELNRRGIH